MGNGKSVLKVYIDEKKKKVMFAEAEEDFVDILLSFFTLPLGTITRLLTKHSNSNVSLKSLYESVVNLDVTHFSNENCKCCLVNPVNSSAGECLKLKVNPDDMEPIGHAHCGPVFLKKKAKFIITDNLKVEPVVLDKSIELFQSLGVDYIGALQERTMHFGVKEFLNLLRWSLFMTNPLTYLVLGINKRPSISIYSNAFISSNNTCQTQTVKLVVQKSKNKVLGAQVDSRFVELLLSFLTIPLGAYERITKDHSSSVGITNLYKSISCLGDGNYLKSEDVKTMLLRPKLAANYLRVTDLLPIYEENTIQCCFLKKQATFVVSDDLKVTSFPSVATISTFNTPGVPIGDMETVEISIGEHEAILLLKVSLTSASALTDWLRVIRKIGKDHVPNIAFAGEGGSRSAEEEAESTVQEEAESTVEERADSTVKEENHGKLIDMLD